MRHQVPFRLGDKTPGALKYKEIDSNGRPVESDADGRVVGTLYLRKTATSGEPKKDYRHNRILVGLGQRPPNWRLSFVMVPDRERSCI